MKKVMMLALGLGLVFGSVSFAAPQGDKRMDDKKMDDSTKTKKHKKGKKKKGNMDGSGAPTTTPPAAK